jgi:hypothetical protein
VVRAPPWLSRDLRSGLTSHPSVTCAHPFRPVTSPTETSVELEIGVAAASKFVEDVLGSIHRADKHSSLISNATMGADDTASIALAPMNTSTRLARRRLS